MLSNIWKSFVQGEQWHFVPERYLPEVCTLCREHLKEQFPVRLKCACIAYYHLNCFGQLLEHSSERDLPCPNCRNLNINQRNEHRVALTMQARELCFSKLDKLGLMIYRFSPIADRVKYLHRIFMRRASPVMAVPSELREVFTRLTHDVLRNDNTDLVQSTIDNLKFNPIRQIKPRTSLCGLAAKAAVVTLAVGTMFALFGEDDLL
jgi:hypothetical protein